MSKPTDNDDSTHSKEALARARDPGEILTEIRQAFHELPDFMERERINAQARFCTWSGQDISGRLKSKTLDYKAKPWEGASDCRPMVLDQLINYLLSCFRSRNFLFCNGAVYLTVSAFAWRGAGEARRL